MFQKLLFKSLPRSMTFKPQRPFSARVIPIDMSPTSAALFNESFTLYGTEKLDVPSLQDAWDSSYFNVVCVVNWFPHEN